jgi:hypothetical protein
MQTHSKFLILRQNAVVKQSFVLPKVKEFELHDRWLSEIKVASVALSNVLHDAYEPIRNQISVNVNFRFLETYEPEL